MPTYEFTCLNCQKRFSLIMSVKEKESGTARCPACKGDKLEQQITSFQVKTSKKS